jgi:hypothetical protein
MPAARVRVPLVDGTPVPRIEFVEIAARSSGTDAEALPPPDEPRWSLWDDPGA